MEVTSRHVPQTPGTPLQVKVTGGGVSHASGGFSW